MIENYYILKRACLTSIVLDGKRTNIGDLNSKQLAGIKYGLGNKDRSSLTDIEKKQLDAALYIIKYRAERPLKELKEKVIQRRVDRANYLADNLANVIAKAYK